jgi:hypothetical protein
MKTITKQKGDVRRQSHFMLFLRVYQDENEHWIGFEMISNSTWNPTTIRRSTDIIQFAHVKIHMILVQD